MTTRAAIDGEYADFKIIRTRDCCQMVIEFPLARGDELIRLFGVPQPSTPKRVAVAALTEARVIEATPNAATTERRRWNELPLPQQAAMRCQEPPFQKFLREEGESGVNDAESAANYVRLICRVHSRADLAKNKDAAILWRDLDGRYRAWMSGAAA